MSETAAPEVRTFNQLRDMRLGYVTSARQNGFEEGLRTLLAELYPDEAHFIYELLQNAEDAGASTVEFELTETSLVATHDGRRPFTLADVVSITGIGKSTKKDDPTKIGKFGVGFKAVFAYTNRPEVRSGEHSFAIVDLFVPEGLDGQPTDQKTSFTFPFDRTEKPAAVARDEIEHGLRALDEKTLLFLSNINSVSYTLPDGTIGIIDRQDHDSFAITIQKSEGDDFVESHWLRLVGPASVEHDGPMPLTVAAAFRLSEAKAARKARKSESGPVPTRTIVPLDAREGEVSIYFPAVKEEAGLRFHIHAPFASTVARDSVRATSENAQLVEDIGRLVASHLVEFRDLDLIDDGFLETLPNEGDALEPPYTAVREVIVDGFNSQSITPMYGGGFGQASELVSTPDEVRSGLELKDLPVLFQLAEIEHANEPKWIAPRRGRAERFLAQLDAQEFGWDGLQAALETMETRRQFCLADGTWAYRNVAPSAESLDRWTSWLAQKSDSSLLDLYRLIGRGTSEGEIEVDHLDTIPIVRLRRNGTVTHVRGPDTYLPESRRDKVQSRVPIDLAYFESDERDDPPLRSFYRAAGVERWNASARIEARLKRYQDGVISEIEVGQNPAKHLEDMAAFVKHGLANPAEVRKTFRPVAFVLVSDNDGQWLWAQPSDVYIDDPYLGTGLATIYDDSKYALPGIYIEIEGIAEFLAAAGATDRIRFVAQSIYSNPQFEWAWTRGTRESSYTIKQDWDIEHFDELVAAGDERLLQRLWETLATVDASHGAAIYRANASNPRRRMDSRAKQRLQNTAWVPSPSGDLVRPRGIEIDSLPRTWVEPRAGSLALDLDFGAEAQAIRSRESQAQEEFQEDLKAVERLGLSSENLEVYRALEEAGVSPEELLEIAAERRAHALLADGASDNPTRRADVAALNAATAPAHAVEQRLRSVVSGGENARAESKSYLRQHYTAESGDMSCQACWKLLPFKVNGDWYFEAVAFVKERKYVHTANALALCPLCSAVYRYKIETKAADLIAGLLELDIASGQGSAELPVLLNGKRVRLRFTGKHAIDLQSALRVAGDQREDA